MYKLVYTSVLYNTTQYKTIHTTICEYTLVTMHCPLAYYVVKTLY